MALKSTNASTARVESSFKQLSTAAQTLHSASDDLRKVIRQLDASLKKLGLGFPAWVQISGSQDEVQYWNRDLGYARIGGKWGLALRDVTGNHIDNEDDAEEVWAFNDAPRAMRIEAVGKIPDLLEKLLQQTEETTKKLQSKIQQASELASIFADLTGGVPALPQWTGRQGGSFSLAAEAGSRGAELEGNGAEKPSHHFREHAAPAAPLPTERSGSGERPASGEKPLPIERTERAERPLPAERGN
jgi:prefoldin subunit 5